MKLRFIAAVLILACSSWAWAGTASQQLNIQVGYALPQISSVNPTTYYIGQVNQFTIQGQYFGLSTSDTTVTFMVNANPAPVSFPVTLTSVSPTAISGSVDLTGLGGATSATFYVQTPGGTSTGVGVSITTQTLTITTTSLPAATPGTSYSAQLTATGGVGAYTWSLTSGTLPTGLTLATNGTISGTPPATSAGQTYTFTITVTDSLGATGAIKGRTVTAPIAKPATTPKK